MRYFLSMSMGNYVVCQIWSLPDAQDGLYPQIFRSFTVYVKGASPFGSSNSSSSAYQKKKRKRGANKFLSRTRPSACPSPPCKKLRRLERGAPGLGRTDTEISFETHKYFLLCANVIKRNICLIFASTFFYNTQMYFVLGLQLTSVLSQTIISKH